MGSQTEEAGNLISQKEVEVVVVVVEAVEAEVVAEVQVGKEELVTGMTTTISALISDPLVPAGIHLKLRNYQY